MTEVDDNNVVLENGNGAVIKTALPTVSPSHLKPASPIEGHQAVVKIQTEVVMADRDFLSALEKLSNGTPENLSEFLTDIFAADKEVLQRNFLLIYQRNLLPYLFNNASKLDNKQLLKLEGFLRKFFQIDFANFDSNLAQAGTEILWQSYEFLFDNWSDLDLLDSYGLVIEKLAKTLTPKDNLYQTKIEKLIENHVMNRYVKLFVNSATGYLSESNLAEVVSLLPLVIASKDFDFCKIFLDKLVSFSNDQIVTKVVRDLTSSAIFNNQQFGEMFVDLRYGNNGASNIKLRSLLPLLFSAQNFLINPNVSRQILNDLNADGLRGLDLKNSDFAKLGIVVSCLFGNVLSSDSNDQAKIELRAHLSQLALRGLLPKLNFRDVASDFDVFQALDTKKNDKLKAEKFLINKLDNLDLKWAYYLLKLIDELNLNAENNNALLKNELILRVGANVKFENLDSNEQIVKNLECLVIDPTVYYARGFDNNGDNLDGFMTNLNEKWDVLLGETSGYAQMLIFLFVINLGQNKYLGDVLHGRLDAWFKDERVDKRFKSDLYQELSKLHLSWSEKFNLNMNKVERFKEKFYQLANDIEPKKLNDKSAADKFEIFLSLYTADNSDLTVVDRVSVFDWFAEFVMNKKGCFTGKYAGPAFQILARNYMIVKNADKSELLNWLGGVLDQHKKFGPNPNIDRQIANGQVSIVPSNKVVDIKGLLYPSLFDRAKRVAVAGLAVVGSFFGFSKSTVSGDGDTVAPDFSIAVSKAYQADLTTSVVLDSNIDLPETVFVEEQQAEIPQVLILQKGEGLERAFRRAYGLGNQEDFHDFLVKVALSEPNSDKAGVSGYAKFLAGFEKPIGDLHPGVVVKVKPELVVMAKGRIGKSVEGKLQFDEKVDEIKFAMNQPGFSFELENDRLNPPVVGEEEIEQGWEAVDMEVQARKANADLALIDPDSELNQGWFEDSDTNWAVGDSRLV
jgi:hypothetical protein